MVTLQTKATFHSIWKQTDDMGLSTSGANLQFNPKVVIPKKLQRNWTYLSAKTISCRPSSRIIVSPKNTAPIRGHCWGWLEMISPLSLLGSFTGFTISPENLVKTMLSGEDFPWIQLDESHLLVSYFAVIHQFWGLFSCKPT
jgi:hypothetical protein